MKKTFYIVFAILLLAVGMMKAQSVQIVLDKKVVLTDSLNMPSNTSAYSVLSMLPELLQRPGESIFSNYDVQVEGMSVSEASDVALQQLQIIDIEKIEIDESPVASFQKNGASGTINFILRSHGSKSDRLWGSAGVAASYPFDLTPQVVIGHRSDRFMVRGLMLGDVYSNTCNEETARFAGGKYQSGAASVKDNKYRSHLARAYMQFMPTQSDLIKFNVSEAYEYDKMLATPNHDADMANTVKERTTNLRAYFSYKHTFGRGELVNETEYIYTPGYKDNIYPTTQQYRDDFNYHTVATKLEWVQQLLSADKAGSLKMQTGFTFNGAFKDDDVSCTVYASSLATPYHYDPHTTTLRLQPYLSLEGVFGKVRFKAVGEYHHYDHDIDVNAVDKCVKGNEFTGKLIVGWQFKPHRALRLIVDRKLQRPSEEQIYPMRYYNAGQMSYVVGDPNLKSMLSHEVKVEYVGDYRWGEHSLLLSSSASYNYIDRIILEKTLSAPDDAVTYLNDGHANVLSANLMSLYRYRSFAVSLTGNVYHSNRRVGGVHNHSTYFNLEVNPHFTLKDGWHGGLSLTYNSKVHQDNGTLGDCTTSAMTIGKRWKQFFVYVFDNIALQKHASDRTGSDDAYVERNYEMAPNTVGFGIKYTF